MATLDVSDATMGQKSGMKQFPAGQKRPPVRRGPVLLHQRLGYIAIAMVTAGLVLIMGSKLEQLFPDAAPPPRAEIAQPTPSPTPIATGSPSPVSRVPAVSPKRPASKSTSLPTVKPSAQPIPVPVAVAPAVRNYFGHLPYSENLPDRLVSIGKFVRENYEREEWLDAEAAQAFQVMVDAARSQNVQLMGISGFRNVADQEALFAKQIERRGSAEAAAKLSAPPGHSEHHTGYAIDITDASRTDVDLKVAFEETAAYQWLMVNANQFGFEQSFPRNNAQGVSYEPWHWRYVGSARSSQIFAAARVGA
ncbi:MAG: hypothetical protein RLZZ511_3734 [Cyanobacteriota bacterium]|jgi:LAS superfamily LD-carboxypeptidase LdcB